MFADGPSLTQVAERPEQRDHPPNDFFVKEIDWRETADFTAAKAVIPFSERRNHIMIDDHEKRFAPGSGGHPRETDRDTARPGSATSLHHDAIVRVGFL